MDAPEAIPKKFLGNHGQVAHRILADAEGMRLLLLLALVLLPIGVLCSWAGAGMLRERRILRQRGLDLELQGAISGTVSVLCLTVGVVAMSGALATLALAAVAFA